MANRLAVIDLGSNTFHLLIVDLDFETLTFTQVFRQRNYIYLAQSGLGKLSSEAMLRGHKCLAHFQEKAKEYGATKFIAIGTSALRSASNGQEFKKQVEADLGLEIDIISGVREADFIFKGASSFLNPKLENHNLIIDIGGGSVEIILTLDSKVLQYWSFDCGISVVRNEWIRQDPPSVQDCLSFKMLMDGKVGGDLAGLKSFDIQNVVGASGPFEIIESHFDMNPSLAGNEINIAKAKKVMQQIVSSSKASRLLIKGMSESRHDLSMESMMILDYFFSFINEPQSLIVTQGALKEGVIAEQLNLG